MIDAQTYVVYIDRCSDVRSCTSVGDEVQTVSVLLITGSPVTQEDLATLVKRGYTVLGSFGHFILVEAPSDYYSDPENGVDGIDFVSNATLPPVTITSASETTPITNGTPAIGAGQMWAHAVRGRNQDSGDRCRV